MLFLWCTELIKFPNGSYNSIVSYYLFLPFRVLFKDPTQELKLEFSSTVISIQASLTYSSSFTLLDQLTNFLTSDHLTKFGCIIYHYSHVNMLMRLYEFCINDFHFISACPKKLDARNKRGKKRAWFLLQD